MARRLPSDAATEPRIDPETGMCRFTSCVGSQPWEINVPLAVISRVQSSDMTTAGEAIAFVRRHRGRIERAFPATVFASRSVDGTIVLDEAMLRTCLGDPPANSAARA